MPLGEKKDRAKARETDENNLLHISETKTTSKDGINSVEIYY